MNTSAFRRTSALAAAIALTATTVAASSSDDAAAVARGRMLFFDNFERAEVEPNVDALGNGWTTNSPWRAANRKQAFMANGVMWVRTADGASHGAALFHDIGPAFRDGAIQVRFQMQPDDSVSLEFADPECREVHAGHIANAVIDRKGITLKDLKAGNQSLAVNERRMREGNTPELKKFLAGKNVTFPFQPVPGKWHQLTMVTRGEVLRVTVDGVLVGELKSEGIAHPTKRKLIIGASRSPLLDDIKVWSLDR